MDNQKMFDLLRGSLPEQIDKTHMKLTDQIRFYMEKEAVHICLSGAAAGLGTKPANMQEDGAAFEAWALVLHTFLGKDCVLEVGAEILPAENSGHCRRFLYRAMKFREQFPWFSLSEKLAEAADQFKTELYDRKQPFTNNVASGEAGSSNKPENIAERLFAGERAELLRELAAEKGISLNKTYRQLPVGLFRGVKAETENLFFTGRKSAIDLWGLSGDELVIFELKTQNPMLGIITELMFYANYLQDMFGVENNWSPSKPKKRCRGYGDLYEQREKLQGICAVMLTDRLHPLITEEVIREMNRGSGFIRYETLHYKMDIQADR